MIYGDEGLCSEFVSYLTRELTLRCSFVCVSVCAGECREYACL